MTKEEHAQLINQIRTAQSDVERNNFLATLCSDYDTMLATASEHSTRIEQLEKDNTEYAKLNNKLFLQLGTPNIEQPNNPPQPPANNPPQKRSYDDLKFD